MNEDSDPRKLIDEVHRLRAETEALRKERDYIAKREADGVTLFDQLLAEARKERDEAREVAAAAHRNLATTGRALSEAQAEVRTLREALAELETRTRPSGDMADRAVNEQLRALAQREPDACGGWEYDANGDMRCNKHGLTASEHQREPEAAPHRCNCSGSPCYCGGVRLPEAAPLSPEDRLLYETVDEPKAAPRPEGSAGLTPTDRAALKLRTQRPEPKCGRRIRPSLAVTCNLPRGHEGMCCDDGETSY